MGTELHDLQPPEGARKDKVRIGRGLGSRRGKTAGRGQKGQLARRRKMKPGFEGGQLPIHRRVPKRGFVNIHRESVHGVNVDLLEGAFEKGAEVTIETLREKGLIPKNAHLVKLLGNGEITKALTIKLHKASKSAREKIEAAGGKLELMAEAASPAEAEG
jgi:large subunit ribosomal protein L15